MNCHIVNQEPGSGGKGMHKTGCIVVLDTMGHYSCRKAKRQGVKKDWGTMRGCSYRTVLSTLQRLTTVAGNPQKVQERGNTEVRWWFLIRGKETVVQNLDQQQEP